MVKNTNALELLLYIFVHIYLCLALYKSFLCLFSRYIKLISYDRLCTHHNPHLQSIYGLDTYKYNLPSYSAQSLSTLTDTL